MLVRDFLVSYNSTVIEFNSFSSKPNFPYNRVFSVSKICSGNLVGLHSLKLTTDHMYPLQEVILVGSNNLNPKLLAEKLKRIRAYKNLSQNEILQKLGSDGILFQGNISQYELGRREPPLLVLLAYARLGGVEVEILINDNCKLPF